jgi:hypothetical protein
MELAVKGRNGEYINWWGGEIYSDSEPLSGFEIVEVGLDLATNSKPLPGVNTEEFIRELPKGF